MKVTQREIVLDEHDLQEIFGLFTSSTKDEKAQVYQRDRGHFFENENLSEEYELTQEKREFSRDAWRAVISLLKARGVGLTGPDGEKIDLAFIEGDFV